MTPDQRDAARYRKLRAMNWHDSPLCVVDSPKQNTKLGAYCPSGELLDKALDALPEPVDPYKLRPRPADWPSRSTCTLALTGFLRHVEPSWRGVRPQAEAQYIAHCSCKRWEAQGAPVDDLARAWAQHAPDTWEAAEIRRIDALGPRK